MAAEAPPGYDDAVAMESVEEHGAAGEEAPAEEGPSILGQAQATVASVVYPDDVVEGSPAWHTAVAAASAAETARVNAAALDEKYKISEAVDGHRKAASDKMAELDAEYKVSEKGQAAYEASAAAASYTAAQLSALNEQHKVTERTAEAAAAAAASASAQAAALDEQYKISESAAHYDAQYGVSEKAAAGWGMAKGGLMSAHAWWKGTPTATNETEKAAVADDAVPAEEVKAESAM